MGYCSPALMALVLGSALKFSLFIIQFVSVHHFQIVLCTFCIGTTVTHKSTPLAAIKKSGAVSSSVALPLLSRSTAASPSTLLKALAAHAIEGKSDRAVSGPRAWLRFHYNVSMVVPVMLGTPPQQVLMVIDTGSELSWVQCQPCNQCFRPLISTSYRNVTCNSLECTTESKDFPSPTTCDDRNVCHFTYSYADGTSSEGRLGRDTVSLGSGLAMPGLVFGCVNSAFLSNSSNGQLSTGIMGLNRGALSFIQQLGNNFPKKFSYCIADPVKFPSSSGVLVMGESPYSDSLQYTPMIMLSVPLPYFNRAAYTVKLEGIKVAEKILPLPKSVFMPDHTGAGQTMIDSGTQFTFLLGTAYDALKKEFLLQTQGSMRTVKEGDFRFQGVLDLCYLLPKLGPLPELPSVTLLFDSAQVRLGGNQLLYPVGDNGGNLNGMNNDTVYCFTFGNSDLVPVAANIIGNHHQQSLWIEYDLEQSRIGFAPAECNMN